MHVLWESNGVHYTDSCHVCTSCASSSFLRRVVLKWRGREPLALGSRQLRRASYVGITTARVFQMTNAAATPAYIVVVVKI